MKIGLWNIDHPEKESRSSRRIRRFTEITRYVEKRDCDLLILTEANSAINLKGYTQYLSEESPFYNKNRCYDLPNKCHQVAIFSKNPCVQIAIAEPINGVLCEAEYNNQPIFIYGNVITIKDQWKKDSDKKHKDRLGEQIWLFAQLLGKKFIIGGDFNLKKGWLQKSIAYQHMFDFVKKTI
ncbi:endonuclease/exonuclease/phosphatase family protein [Desulfofustis glycolicus]|uniref:Endonuclease/Exonuclease/phosphatase family protein n=1 Tax=Desulfofustis glycolicus DSM 9705 TaxID=1121409 RepID=A0A1M5YJ32_9BACT|nr:endonuclease/exonuclease/phosphatase family protein [Desulfofustis glycolicus]SHI12040.1 Endonuclease/Exonuclease/phosphatase family protein [Desulfofustis glycolicus DSM 9705]